jgi:hypothetical protein
MRRKQAFYDNPGIRRKARQKSGKARLETASPTPVAKTESKKEDVPAPRAHGWPLQTVLLLALLPVALGLVIVRATGLVTWPWGLVLSPLTVAGAAFLGLFTLTVFARYVDPVRRVLFGKGDERGATAPPEQLEPPLAADAMGDRILAQHPELLAALCLGFRMKRYVPMILGRPVTDPWGVYAAALTASSLELEQLRMVAKLHVDAYAKSPQIAKRGLSDAELMRAASSHFRQCAEDKKAQRKSPDCPFEHVVVIYGSRVPSRDGQLKSVAPRVRALLEKQYPQIATASLADGSHVKYSEWQKQAAADRKELEHERKEHERTTRKLDETVADLAEVRGQIDALRATVEDARNEARAAARAEQARALEEMRAVVDRTQQESTRQQQRYDSEIEKNSALIESLTAERDTLERALFIDAVEDEDAAEIDAQKLAGLRVLLVGGDDRQAKPVREHAESLGVQMLHADSVNASQLIGSADIVVFWIRYLSHPKMYAVRRECRVRGAQHCYWMRTSPTSLVSLLARARGSEDTLTG